MDLKKCVFIIGSGRSGTTILYDILCTHPDLAWFSNISNNHPGSRGYVYFNRLLDFPLIGPYLKKNIIKPTTLGRALTYYVRPNEGVDVYKTCGFDDNRRMTEDDYDPEMERKLKDIIAMHLEVTSKSCFINKRTANAQRVRLINRLFPDAYYIHMIRDGRAVIDSHLNVDWWNDMTAWWLGAKVGDWKEQGKDPVEFAAKQWWWNMEEILRNKNIFKNYLEVRYETFVKDTWGEVGRMLDLCELPFPESFKRIVPQSLPDMNYKWRKHFSKEQLLIVDENAGDMLRELGYTDS